MARRLPLPLLPVACGAPPTEDAVITYARLADAASHGADHVYADAWASVYDRPAARLIDPTLDLTLPLDTLESRGWILPSPR
ncbi:MAG: hypothetical protein EP330_09810 [Deltaproteobacteria bacterium]|nr:MAG: hypothetical protein EP330_09810 [Deltaproteobacteria bacterium]